MSDTTGAKCFVKVDSVVLALTIDTGEVLSNESVALACKSDEFVLETEVGSEDAAAVVFNAKGVIIKSWVLIVLDSVTADVFVRKYSVVFNNGSATFVLKAGEVSDDSVALELKTGGTVSKDSVALGLGTDVANVDKVALLLETDEVSEGAADLKIGEVVDDESGKPVLRIGRVVGSDSVIFLLNIVDVLRLLLQLSISITSVFEDASTTFSL